MEAQDDKAETASGAFCICGGCYFESQLRHFFSILKKKFEPNLRGTHPEVLALEAVDAAVTRADLAEVREEGVHVVEAADALVQGVHHLGGVLLQLLAARLLLARLQRDELLEQVEQLLVFLEQPGSTQSGASVQYTR